MRPSHLLSFILALMLVINVQAGIIVLEGTYQGKNLFVKNPFGGAGVGFCVYEVTINGKLSPDEVNQSAFEIDFAFHNVKIGEAVIVNIKHKDDCSIEVLNPEVLKPKSTFNTQKISFSNDGVLKWTTTDEMASLDFIVEQFRWNKWVKVGEVEGKGSRGVTEYSYKIQPHSGENKARVKQIDYSGKPRYSPSATFYSDKSPVTLNKTKFKDEVVFEGGETMFEIYDEYGTIVKRGYGKNADVSTLGKGTYYLSFDNKTETVRIR